MDEDSSHLIEFTNSNSIHRRSLYKKRWIILTIVSLINICNAGIWVSFTSVSDRAALFYQTDEDDIDLFSSVFFMATILVGFIAMWTLDKTYGLKLGIYCGAFLTAIGIGLRALSSADFFVNLFSVPIRLQFIIAIVGQGLAGCAQPFVLFTPTKVAEFWFPTTQRALATTITGMSNPMGIVLGNLISPLIVTHYQRIPFLSIIWTIPSIITLLLTLIFVRSSKPPTPPSDSAEVISSTPYFTGIKELLTQKPYLTLMLFMGCSVGIFSALVTILEQIVKTKGYGDRFSSELIAIMIVSGLVGSGLVSYIVDKNKKYITFMKLAVGLSAISINGFFVSLNYSNAKLLIGIFGAIFGFFGFMTYPLGLELGIECTFPAVQEATTSGILILSSQLQGILFIYLTTQSAKEDIKGNLDYKYSLIMLSAIVVFISSLFILIFNTEYKRLKCETINNNSNRSNSQRNSIPIISDNSNSIYS